MIFTNKKVFLADVCVPSGIKSNDYISIDTDICFFSAISLHQNDDHGYQSLNLCGFKELLSNFSLFYSRLQVHSINTQMDSIRLCHLH